MDSTVFVMDVNSTITGPDVQRGFHLEARYEFKVHFDPPGHETLTYRVSFGESDSDGRPHSGMRSRVRQHAKTRQPARSCWRAGRANQPAGATRGSGRDASRIRSISTCRYSASSIRPCRTEPPRTGRHGTPRTRGTASPTRPSNRSCWRSPTNIRRCTPVRTSACGAERSWPQTRAAGSRSTALATL